MLQTLDVENVVSLSFSDCRFYNPKELQKSSSAQSSFHGSQTIQNYKSEENLYFYKFDNVLQDECGLKHFKVYMVRVNFYLLK